VAVLYEGEELTEPCSGAWQLSFFHYKQKTPQKGAFFVKQ